MIWSWPWRNPSMLAALALMQLTRPGIMLAASL
jgi:hypothetical protein